ncbi:EAL domain-containing protein [Massilia sp. PAMC28688]|uniref:putative bifunctional diguanylate cyclase/phosphodiesterase n=1 Tax=Massilia sp. PAMC28688 TaxID=2861283 RepID=UPI001C62EE8B|nr:EAL domain-containing protein [Massilia sp. PAMC28688]QYF92982.1 EAL domain-containing protein [Massilia sp. PAMC28688]
MPGLNQAPASAQDAAQPTIDVLGDALALIDESGVIMQVNRAWREFPVSQGAPAIPSLPGTSYLEACDRAGSQGAVHAGQVAAMARSVLSGQNPRAEMHYACERLGLTQWYKLRIAPAMLAGAPRWLVVQEAVAEPLAAERQLRLHERMLASVEQAVIVTDLSGAILFWNQAAERQYGWAASEVLGRDIVSVVPATTSQAQATQIMERLQQGESWSGEFLVRHRSGRQMPVHVTDAPMRDERGRLMGVIGISTDMTEQKKTEKALQLSNMVYQAIGEAIMVLDMAGLVVAINPAFTALTGFSEAELLGVSADVLVSAANGHFIGPDAEPVLSRTGHWSGSVRTRSKSGDDCHLWLTIDTIFDANDRGKLRICMFSAITDQKRAKETIWLQANYDVLTGLPNRSMFRDRLEHEIGKAGRSRQQLALLFIDLDQFKEVNDTLGHHVGDELLKEVAGRLVSCVREVDTVARIGGDEFTVIIGELADRASVERIAGCIVHAMAQPFHVGGNRLHVSASVGITLYPADARDAATLIKNADQAMYAAKNHGRNQFHYFTERMQLEAQRRMHLTNDLRGALGRQELELAYQPIIALATGALHKAEALLRWRHPGRGLVSPAQFIPVAEQSGIITSIGEWVYQRATDQARLWREQRDPLFQVSINLSPAQLRHRGGSAAAFVRHAAQLADLAGTRGGCAIVEITEGLLLESNQALLKELQALRDAGIQLAIDDFGTGYSALSYLRTFRVDFLKIDQTFVTNLHRGSADLAMCEAIIALAHRLGIKVIAEGIERQEQCDLLTLAGCDYGQGYLFARPLTATAMGEMLDSAADIAGQA